MMVSGDGVIFDGWGGGGPDPLSSPLDPHMGFMLNLYFQICEKFDAAMTKISYLEEENKQLREETEKFDANQKNFEKNISSLLVTARSELNRKEREIKALRYGYWESWGLNKHKN